MALRVPQVLKELKVLQQQVQLERQALRVLQDLQVVVLRVRQARKAPLVPRVQLEQQVQLALLVLELRDQLV